MGGSGGRARQSLVPHDDDQPSDRVHTVVQLVAEGEVLDERLQRHEQPAAPQVGVGGSGEGEGLREGSAHGESAQKCLPSSLTKRGLLDAPPPAG